MFFDRKRELGFLAAKYREKAAQLVVLYGKRRVGKTELIKHFFQGKPRLYYLADRLPESTQLAELGRIVGAHFKDTILSDRGFARWDHLFQYLRERTQGRRLIVVIDEFPYLVESSPAVPSLFQKGWDEYLKTTGVFLVLLGSSVSMMEGEVLGQKAPLYGRRTGQLLVQPFPLSELRTVFPEMTFEERLSYWAALGGTPFYLMKFDPRRSFLDNVRRCVLRKGELLYEEVEFLLREELKEPRNYFSILRAIDLGKRKLGEIINETGLPANVLSKYLAVLRDLRIVDKEVPVTELAPEKSKRGLYKIVDNFFKFWFRFVFLNRRLLEEGETGYVRRKIKADLPQFLADAYEEALPELLREARPRLSFPIAGRWWMGSEEIDLVALDVERRTVLFGEAKWSTRPVGTDVFESLVAKSERVEWRKGERRTRFALFSRSGFTPAMKRRARERDVLLFHGESLLSGRRRRSAR